jgi:signal peptide peptidase-like 2B
MIATNANGSVELTICHAAVFVVIASGMLLLLFFFQFYTAVTVLYAIGCSGSVSQILFRPLYTLLCRMVGQESCVKSSTCPKIYFWGFHQILWLDLLSGFSGYLLGGMWLLVWFSNNDPSAVPFYWITQNIMGACLCILFLSLLKLNSIKVASVLLFAVFIYDIFFVFITPLFLESSVMVTVATGGGGPDASVDYCEKYPDDPDCKATALPMLLALPKINDYRGGQHLLGLGDIVLPGLLISFAARLDEAKRLIGGHTTLDVKLPTRFGYLSPLIIAYAVGLLFANLAVVWLDGGQPALLYLVPACGGTMIYVGWHELGELWRGPKVIRWADNLVLYCERHTFVGHPSDDEATVVDDESLADVDDSTPSIRSIA